MATKSLSKSAASKGKLGALKSLMLNVARGAAAKRKEEAKAAAALPKGASAPAKNAPAAAASSKGKPAEVKAAKGKAPTAPAAAKSKPVEAKAAAPAPAKAKTKAARPIKGAAITSLGVGVFAAPVTMTGSATDAICREVACEALGTTGGYCRLHYIKNWRKIQRKALILREKKLNHYIEELVAKYPDKYIEAIRQDLADDNAFNKVIRDLDLDESVDDFEGDGEGIEAVIDTIKRDFEDEGEGF